MITSCYCIYKIDYEVILKYILGIVKILNLELKVKSVNKKREATGGEIFMESHLIFSTWDISFLIQS